MIRNFTGDILSKVRVIDYEGRHFLAHTDERFDVIDLSLAEFGRPLQSRRLRHRGEVPLHQGGDGDLHARARAGRRAVGHALEQGGAAEVGAEALRDDGGGGARGRPRPLANSFFVASSYLSTATVLYKNGGFTPEEIDKLRAHTRAMSFDEIYSPGFVFDPSQTDSTLDGYVEQIFAGAAGGPPARPAAARAAARRRRPTRPTAPRRPSGKADDGVLPATVMGRLAWHALIAGDWPEIAYRYVFNTRALTNDAPYFAAYMKTATCRASSTGSSFCRTSGAIC